MVKKPDGGYHICIDYRKLNAVTVKDRYPLPNPAMIFDKLAGCQFFSKFDLRWTYFQVRVAEEDVHKTSFRSPSGSFTSRVMSMGLTNAAPTVLPSSGDSWIPFFGTKILFLVTLTS